MKGKYTVAFFIFLIMTGCQNNSTKRNLDEEQKIYINETDKNYADLIELYKNSLKCSDTAKTCYKLAQAYYLSSDFDSAEQILSPIISKTQDDNVLVLYSRILSKTNVNPNNFNRYKKAIKYLDKALQINPKNGEAYNLKGIIEIKMGHYDTAHYSFSKAKEMFYDENKVSNNLAMLDILEKNYLSAYQRLNILYIKGYRNEAILHNLLYTLVKLNNITAAEQLCIEHKISNQPVTLIEELKYVEPNKAVYFIDAAPTLDEMNKIYTVEKNTAVANGVTLKLQPLAKSTIINQSVLPSPKYSSNINLVTVRSGEHKLFSRITFETNNKMASTQYSIQKEANNIFQIKLSDISLTTINTKQIIQKIQNSDRNFINVTANYDINNGLVLKLKVKNISENKVSYAGSCNKGYCVAIDFYIDQ